MKDLLRRIASAAPNALAARNLTREYLQARILQELQESGVFVDWVFLGGTALRFLYSLPRFSEDLDFATLPSCDDDLFGQRVESVGRAFESEGYEVSAKVSDAKAVKSGLLRFRGLLHELGLPAQRSETLAIRVEIDTNPPGGAGVESTLVRRHVTLNLLHHDRASLLAGKLHALLARPFTKGRDLHDLVWYLSDPTWPEPNLALLNAALEQTEWKGRELLSGTWRGDVWKRLEPIDWRRAVEDVRPFAERPGEVDLISPEHCRRLLRQ